MTKKRYNKRLNLLSEIQLELESKLPNYKFMLKLPEDAVSQYFTCYHKHEKYDGFALDPERKDIAKWMEVFIINHSVSFDEKFEKAKAELINAISDDLSEDLISILRRRCVNILEDLIKKDFNL